MPGTCSEDTDGWLVFVVEADSAAAADAADPVAVVDEAATGAVGERCFDVPSASTWP